MRWTSLRAGRGVLADGKTSANTKSDLPKRLISAAVMIAVAAGALWAGDPWLDRFIAFVVAVTLGEFMLLALRTFRSTPARLVAVVAGTLYIVLAGVVLTRLPIPMVVGVVGTVVAVDTFAYIFGRTLGGPKIAPSISPSKTWAGLLGGIVGASGWLALFVYYAARQMSGPTTLPFETGEIVTLIGVGTTLAIAAQAGDFFESWLKRRAGVKDSSNLVPGHGGFFDRTDGMIPVILIAGVAFGVL